MLLKGIFYGQNRGCSKTQIIMTIVSDIVNMERAATEKIRQRLNDIIKVK